MWFTVCKLGTGLRQTLIALSESLTNHLSAWVGAGYPAEPARDSRTCWQLRAYPLFALFVCSLLSEAVEKH